MLRAVRRTCSKLTPGLQEESLGFFRDLLGKILWDKAMEARWPKEIGQY